MRGPKMIKSFGTIHPSTPVFPKDRSADILWSVNIFKMLDNIFEPKHEQFFPTKWYFASFCGLRKENSWFYGPPLEKFGNHCSTLLENC